MTVTSTETKPAYIKSGKVVPMYPAPGGLKAMRNGHTARSLCSNCKCYRYNPCGCTVKKA